MDGHVEREVAEAAFLVPDADRRVVPDRQLQGTKSQQAAGDLKQPLVGIHAGDVAGRFTDPSTIDEPDTSVRIGGTHQYPCDHATQDRQRDRDARERQLSPCHHSSSIPLMASNTGFSPGFAADALPAAAGALPRYLRTQSYCSQPRKG